ncbi:VPLPA-CTERM sorting domain-containing protein [Octadecabacter sp. CECT 8868]|uniref:VPLPA-CTERM sorting domain-containing protein n=1 Tax=Octadecabacter algicola TaxID=2909342 RepID=UPI001F45DDBA|nr:VPLPA-CTERM sorting domain-containing protein [Octadecabacter algicola]MCF2903557.1 VPLPA-CTERM sorting domain-containing protein [Octadecabacter algicola]
MHRSLIVWTMCLWGSTSVAAPIGTLDLDLKVESIGFSNVTIYGDTPADNLEFDFLDLRNDIWGITKPHTRFSIGEEISFTAEFNEQSGQLDPCSIGGFSCSNAYGRLDNDAFSFGDGAGFTSWGDFNMEGEATVGSLVSLSTFSGGLNYETVEGGEFISWDMYVHNFSVLRNNQTLNVVPVPASFPLLIAALTSLGFINRRRRTRGLETPCLDV